MLSGQPVRLPVSCAHCRSALTLLVADWTPDIYAQRSAHEYICPTCQKHQTVTLPGRLVEVKKRAS